jgi:predicted anti-sigma-YlaC factor YlaD
MPMSRCENVIERVSSIMDGEASVIERARFHAHLAMCTNCTAYYQQMRAVRDAAGTVKAADLPSDFEDVLGGIFDKLDGPDLPD